MIGFDAVASPGLRFGFYFILSCGFAFILAVASRVGLLFGLGWTLASFPTPNVRLLSFPVRRFMFLRSILAVPVCVYVWQ